MFSEKSLKAIQSATYDTELEDVEFAKFQRDHLISIFRDFDYDKCTISLIETDGRTGTVDFETVLYGIDAPVQEVMDNYAKFVEEDNLSKIVYANPGRVFLHSDVYEGMFENYPIFKNHCAKYGIHKVCSVGFSLIPIDEYFIAFDYMAGEQTKKWPGINVREIEYASFPFALAWLARKKRVGQKQLEQHFSALSGMTLKKLEKVRRFINSTATEDLTDQAKSLKLKLAGYDSALYEIRDLIVSRFQEDFENVTSHKSLKLEVIKPYCFLLSMMKNQTLPIIVPENVQLTSTYKARLE